MPPAPPPALQLARRLRQLRQQHWPDTRLTQDTLARAFSIEESLAAATVASWENLHSPKLPPRHRLLAYARFFATTRSIEAEPRLLSLESLSEDEKSACTELQAELLMLRQAASGEPDPDEIPFSRSWYFPDAGPIALICGQLPSHQAGPLSDPGNPNYTELQKYSDLDAIVELHGHVRAENPAMDVFIKAATSVTPDDLTGHVVLIGEMALNGVIGELAELAQLPVRQAADPQLDTDIFIAKIDGKDTKFLPTWKRQSAETHSSTRFLAEDVGLLARVPNPLNSSRTLTICGGIHSRGVLGAVRCLTDQRLREWNERYISRTFGATASFSILMSVKVIEQRTMTPDFNSRNGVLYRWPPEVSE